jgi:hypothetical protein
MLDRTASIDAMTLASQRLARKRRRLERELNALRLMNQKLWLIELSLAVVAIPFIAVLCVMILAAQHWPLERLVPMMGAIFSICAVVWWIGRRWWLPVHVFFWIAWLSLMILTKSVSEPPLGLSSKKEVRRAKLDRAIAKREAMLHALGQPTTATCGAAHDILGTGR